jgi:hypothetical protein
LPWFLIPKRRYTMKLMARGVQLYATVPTTYRDAVTKLGATGPSHTQLFWWVALMVERGNVLLLDVQAGCVSKPVPDEDLEKAEMAKCPNSEAAVIVGKGRKLDQLAQLVAQASLFFGDVQGVMEKLAMHFLQNVEQMQQMFANEGLWLQTPQRMKP